MDDHSTEDPRAGARPHARDEQSHGAAATPPAAAAHRRRRWAALATVAVLALLAGTAVGSGSGGAHAARVAPVKVAEPRSALFSRIVSPGRRRQALARAERMAETNAIARTLARMPYVRHAGSQHREIALTFDDGPGPYTPAVLRVLKHLHTAATFFEVGALEQYFHAATAEIVARGYPIGDHTENHAPMSQLPRQVQQTQLLQDAVALGSNGAPFPRMFRPPYGLWDATTLRLLRQYRMLMVLWSVDPADYQLPGTDAIVARTLAGARPGAIVLLHDAGGNRSETVAALPRIIRRLRARGYRLVTVPRLLLDNPPPRNQNIAAVVGSGG